MLSTLVIIDIVALLTSLALKLIDINLAAVYDVVGEDAFRPILVRIMLCGALRAD